MKIHPFFLVGLCGFAMAIGCPSAEPPESADFGRFKGEVVAVWDDDGRHMTLREDFMYVDSRNRRWVAPAGAVVDGASIPAAFWSLIGGPFAGRYRNASVVHDVECVDMTAPWQDVHRMFYEACRCGGVDERMAKIMYYAVYHFGPRWETVAETRVETAEDEKGEVVQREVTEQRVVRFDPPPPTLEEVEQVEAFIAEENPEPSAIERTDRQTLRRRPRRPPGRTRTDDGSGRPPAAERGWPPTRGRPADDPDAPDAPDDADAPDDVDDAEPDRDGESRGDRAPALAGDEPVAERGQRAWSGPPRTRPDGRRRPRPADTSLPEVTPEERQWAEEQVRLHIEQQTGQQRPAEYDVERTRDGFRVFVHYLHLDDEGEPTGETFGASTVRLSPDGRVREMTSGR